VCFCQREGTGGTSTESSGEKKLKNHTQLGGTGKRETWGGKKGVKGGKHKVSGESG